MKRTLAFLTLLTAITVPIPTHAIFGLGGCSAAAAGGAAASAAGSAAAAAVTVPTNPITIVPQQNVIAANETAQTTKECILDGLAYTLTQTLIASITDNIINWINNGFEGGPAFVTNLNGLLGEVADNVAVNFIEGADLGFLCSPFEIPVRVALINNYQSQRGFSNRISCSLGDVTNNIQGFLGGDFFGGGGWSSWFTLATDFNNNAYRNYLVADDERVVRTAQEQFGVQLDFEVGGGLLSKGKCDHTTASGFELEPLNVVENDTSTRNGCLSSGGTWRVTTPGSLINATLQKWTGLGADRLAVADEIDEILNALLAQLAQQALTSFDGLAGLSSSNSSSAFDGQSYLQRLTTETGAASVTEAKAALLDDIEEAADIQNDYSATLGDLIGVYDTNSAQFEELRVCAINSFLFASVNDLTDSYQDAVNRTEEVVAKLVVLANRANTANTSTALNQVATDYEALIASGEIQNNSDIAFLTAEANCLAEKTQ